MKSLSTYLMDEGLLDTFKLRKQITELQGVISNAFEEAMKKNPKRFTSGQQVVDACKTLAQEKYKELVTAEGAISFDEWWKKFSKANAHLLDMTVFDIK